MTIRKLMETEINQGLELALNVFLEYEAPDYSEEGVETFKNYIEDKEAMLALEFYGAFKNEMLVGVMGVRNKNHITLLFIKGKFHKQGIGRMLLGIAIEDLSKEFVTVNSSPYAVEFYHKMGFKDVESEKTISGIRFTPMKFMNIKKDGEEKGLED